MGAAQSLAPVAIGIGIGLAGCIAATRILKSLLFGVSPLDPVVFTGVALFLGLVALFASYAPAARVDPLTALRHE